MGGWAAPRRYCGSVMAVASAPTNVIAPRRSVYRHVVELWSYRELLGNLIRKELKVRYKNSALGFAWSLLNPAMLMVVYTIVFQVVLKNGVPYFPIYLLSGLLAWNLLSTSLSGATSSITGNPTLVNKVYFPREILPLASVGANCVHFLLQATVLLATIALSPVSFDLRWCWLVVPALLVMLLLAAALSVFLSAINVYARDTQHLLELVLLAWLWMTPIVYQWRLVADKVVEQGLPSWLVLLNPITSVTLAMQRSLYGQRLMPDANGHLATMLPPEGQWWYLRNLGIVGGLALVLFILAMRVFNRLEGNFAEEL
jgi:ABC-2 type transport system permease protein